MSHFSLDAIASQNNVLSLKQQRSLAVLAATNMELGALISQEAEMNPLVMLDYDKSTESDSEYAVSGDEIVDAMEQEDHYDIVEDMQRLAEYLGTMPVDYNGTLTEDEKDINDYWAPFDSDMVIVVPEAYVHMNGAGVGVTINDEPIPQINLSRHYMQMLKLSRDAEVKEFLGKRLQSAKDLIAAINQRTSMLQKTVKAIFDAQQKFMAGGYRKLKPLIMADIAKVVGHHETTVFRAINNKFVQTPQGLVMLKLMFSSNIDGRSSVDIKFRIKDILAKHPTATDEEISRRLARQHVEISRRTVNKYRNSATLG